MKYFLNSAGFASREVNSYVKTIKSIATTSQYDNIVKKLISLFKNKSLDSAKFTLFYKEKVAISKSKPLTEKTPWGGVALKKVDVGKNYIRKLLVIKKHGVLGFEIHKLKHEKLKIVEGTCIVLYSSHSKPGWKPGKVSVKIASTGDKFEFLPNDEHGIIALTNCVIEETSTNHLDDLVYIFKAEQAK